MYEYQAKVVRVVDADTVWFDVDLGFDVRRKDSFRLYGINAPELGTPEGVAAKDWLVARLPVESVVHITTNKDKREKYGRYLATIFVGGINLNEALVAAGHAVPYMVTPIPPKAPSA